MWDRELSVYSPSQMLVRVSVMEKMMLDCVRAGPNTGFPVMVNLSSAGVKTINGSPTGFFDTASSVCPQIACFPLAFDTK